MSPYSLPTRNLPFQQFLRTLREGSQGRDFHTMGSSKNSQRYGEKKTDLVSYTVMTREWLLDGGLGLVGKGKTMLGYVKCC
jgi:hypothetical protein